MNTEHISCPSCSAPVSISPDASQTKCAYCGSTVRVPRSEGEVALRTTLQMTTAIANSSAQTKAAIGESAAVTREELQRLQFTQELSNLELRLATVQSEIRTLNRMPATKVTKQQLRQLRGQEIGIEQRIAEVYAILNPALPAPPHMSGSTDQGCMTGLLTLLAWIFLFPFMLAIKLIGSENMSARTAGYVLVGVFVVIIGLGNMAKAISPSSHPRATPTKTAPTLVPKQLSVAAASTTIAQTAVAVFHSVLPTATPQTPSATPTQLTVLVADDTTTETQNQDTVAAASPDTAQATAFPTMAPPTELSQGGASARMPAERANMYSAAPEMMIAPAKIYYATFRTAKGDVKVQLFADRAPLTVNNFVYLAREGFYNDTVFHRVIEGFMAQGGDPTGEGAGGPGYQFGDEIWPGAVFDRPGLLAMANAGPSTNGSQFFITFGPTEWLNGQHTIFGEVTEGLDVLDKLKRVEPPAGQTGDTLYTVTIEESDTSKLPTPTPLPPTPTPFAPTGTQVTDRPLATVPLEERAGYFNTAPENTLDTSKSYTAIIATSKGNLVMELYDDLAPVAVNNFVTLANLGFYDGTQINDVAPGELVVLGSPTGDPSSDVGYTFKPEVNVPITSAVGSVAYRSVGQDKDGSILASGSQLYLAVTAPPADVNESYSFFGQIISGQDILPNLTVSDTIQSVTVQVQ